MGVPKHDAPNLPNEPVNKPLNGNPSGNLVAAGTGSSLFLFNPVNISLSVVLFLFFFVIVFLVACFVFSKSRKSSALKNHLKKHKKQLHQSHITNNMNNTNRESGLNGENAIKLDQEQLDEKHYSSSSSTKSSLSACSHLTGTWIFIL